MPCLILSDFIILIILREDCKAWSLSLYSFLSLYLSLVHIFSSAPCCQTFSVCVAPLMLEIKLYTHTEHRQILGRRQNVLDWMVVNFIRIQHLINFLLKEILICCFCLQFIWIVPHFQIICYLSLCYDFALHSGGDSNINSFLCPYF
jgi:hypothetical protein